MLKQSLVENLKKRGFNEEQIEYIDEELYGEFKKNNGYKILCGRKYALYINEYQGKIFYKILIKKKYKDGTNYVSDDVINKLFDIEHED